MNSLKKEIPVGIDKTTGLVKYKFRIPSIECPVCGGMYQANNKWNHTHTYKHLDALKAGGRFRSL